MPSTARKIRTLVGQYPLVNLCRDRRPCRDFDQRPTRDLHHFWCADGLCLAAADFQEKEDASRGSGKHARAIGDAGVVTSARLGWFGQLG